MKGKLVCSGQAQQKPDVAAKFGGIYSRSQNGDVKGGAYPGKRLRLDKGVEPGRFPDGDIEGEVPAQAGENPGNRLESLKESLLIPSNHENT